MLRNNKLAKDLFQVSWVDDCAENWYHHISKNKIKSLHATAIACRPHLVPPPKQEPDYIDILLIFVELVKSMVWGKLNASTHLGLVISYPVQLGQLNPLEGSS